MCSSSKQLVFHCVVSRGKIGRISIQIVQGRRLSVIGERIVCLFAHENKLKKKIDSHGNQTRADKGACWWLHEKRGASVINGAKTNQRLNLKEKYSESILSEYYIPRQCHFHFEIYFLLCYFTLSQRSLSKNSKLYRTTIIDNLGSCRIEFKSVEISNIPSLPNLKTYNRRLKLEVACLSVVICLKKIRCTAKTTGTVRFLTNCRGIVGLALAKGGGGRSTKLQVRADALMAARGPGLRCHFLFAMCCCRCEIYRA